ncbi:uncharacterized protein LOC112557990 [Pomacea canaliculata]|uniref:uncharacterized protein LOC112557990 n=1 Tax=Pomacea canaliculata TaxID=400727 RepID=UPI000D73845A|nr:uncharacterized protein LOC112557990 [Pomacea canaliculata]
MGGLLMWKTALVVLLLEAVTVTAVFQKQVCDLPPPSKDYPEPPKRPNVPTTFEVHVDCKITNKNMSTEIHEYYDYNNNRGLLHQVQDGEPFYLYYDYNTNEMLSIFPNERICYADALSTDKNTFLFGYEGSGGKGYIFPPSGALHFEFDDETSAYLGPGVVRGIRVRRWYACQYVDQMDATVNVYWSFSDPNNWDTAVGYPEIPVRCQVNGVATEVRHNYTHNFTHTYDFLHFQNFITRPDVFETPDEIVCPGRKNTKALPSLPDAFSFTMEAVSTANHQVTFLREWYDYQMQLVRLEYSPGPAQMLKYGPRPLTEIHDFSTGVAYIMDRELGNCSVTPIERSQLGDVVLSGDLTTVHLRTAQQFFYLDKVQPVYLGQKTVRGISCDAWVANGSVTNASSTWEWCFRAANWTSVEDARAQTGSPSGTPVQMKLLLADAQYDFNFYHFVRADPDVLRYDVSSCFTSTRRRKFDFAVSGQFAATVQKNLRQFRVAVQNAIIKVTGLSPLRIVEIQVVYLSDVHIRVTLLDKPKNNR